MKRTACLAALACAQFTATSALAQARPAVVEMQTNLGTFAIELDYARTPVTADNFVAYVNAGFYRNTLIHRVVPGFVIQGGGFDRNTLALKTTRAPIVNEAINAASNLTGTVAMARTTSPNSATSQFFVNLVDNTFLNYGGTSSPDGYAVFGRVIKGMDVVQRIGALRTFLPRTADLPVTATSSLVWFEAAYTNDVWNTSVSRTRILLSGSGTVTSVPAGIDCPSASCRISQQVGRALTLTATPAAGFAFGGWRGDCTGERTTLRIDTTKGNHNCTAVFNRLGAERQ